MVEIAALRISPRGDVLDEYATLVNPHRDVGPTHIHRIKAGDVMHAPSFEDIAGDIVARLAGAVFVAHNAHFDMRFLRQEFDRIGCTLPEFSFLCTMQLARRADPAIASRRLSDACVHFGISFADLHSAEADVRAEAQLLAACLAKIADESDLSGVCMGLCGEPTPRHRWPSLPATGRSHRRTDAVRTASCEPTYIANLVAKLPSTSDLEPDIEQYLCSLDKVLEDRRVTAEEADELLAMAGDCGVTRDRAVAAHEAYMREMLRVALEDGVITELEREDLEVVRLLLGIGSIDYERLLEHARNGAATLAQPTQPPPIEGRDLQGKKICFTGMLRGHIKGTLVTRPLAEQIASEHGMIVLQQVTKKLDFLVTADPDSMSGKARKARDYGVRIIAEPVFWKMVGIQTQ